MAIDVGEIVSDIPDVLNLVQQGAAAIKALPADASDLACATAVVEAVVPGLCALLRKIEGQAKS